MEVALIVAGGSGKRMGSETPKQFLELLGIPILMHTVQSFWEYSPKIKIVVVLPPEHKAHWQELIVHHNFKIPHHVCKGGYTRTLSVRNGLEFASDEDLVAIHDGVRPLVSKQVIAESFDVAQKSGCAVPSILIKDSIRKITDSGTSASVAVDRTDYRAIQTPQTFQGHIIKRAYTNASSEVNYQDDASIVEAQDYTVTLFAGSESNIKITKTEDLTIAAELLKLKSK